MKKEQIAKLREIISSLAILPGVTPTDEEYEVLKEKMVKREKLEENIKARYRQARLAGFTGSLEQYEELYTKEN